MSKRGGRGFSKAAQTGKKANQPQEPKAADVAVGGKVKTSSTGPILDFLAPAAAAARAKAAAALVEEVKLAGISDSGDAGVDRVVELDVKDIEPNPFQPRKHFDLAPFIDSLRVEGQLYPILVRRLPNGKYQVADGETRLRAFKEIHKLSSYPANLKKIQAIVRDFNDQQMAVTAFRSAYERNDLNIVEEAAGFDGLMKQFKWNIKELSEAVGKSYTYVHQRISILNLSKEMQSLVVTKKIPLSSVIELSRAQSELSEDSFRSLVQVVTDSDYTTVQIRTQIAKNLEAAKAAEAIKRIENDKRMKAEEKHERISTLLPAVQQSTLAQTRLPAAEGSAADTLNLPPVAALAPPAQPTPYKNNPLRVKVPPAEDPVLKVQKELFSLWPELSLDNKKRLLAYAIQLRADQSKHLAVKDVD